MEQRQCPWCYKQVQVDFKQATRLAKNYECECQECGKKFYPPIPLTPAEIEEYHKFLQSGSLSNLPVMY